MANEALVNALEKARQRMLDANGEPVVKGWNRQILYYFPDVEEYWLMQVVEGMPEPPAQQPDEVDGADIRLTMAAETFIGLMNGTVNSTQAFITGKVKVKASMADMGKMQVFV
jgi:hypothetical protein